MAKTGVKIMLSDGYEFFASNVRMGAYEMNEHTDYKPMLDISVNSIDFSQTEQDNIVDEITKRRNTAAFNKISVFINNKLTKEYAGFTNLKRNGEFISETGAFLEIQFEKSEIVKETKNAK